MLTQASSMSNLEEKFNEFVSKFVKFNSELQQCKKFHLYLQTRIIQLKHKTVANSQYRGETIELNPVPADITEDVLEEHFCKGLSLTGVNVVPNDLHACHQMKMPDSHSHIQILQAKQFS